MVQYQYLNDSLAFLEGLALILSPCILPVLPILFAGTVTGGKHRLIGMMVGFVLLFAMVTALLNLIVQHLGLDAMLLRMIGFAVIFCFGIILISDRLSTRFSRYTQGISQWGEVLPSNTEGGFLSGLLLGGSLALIWTPCGGPILAAALVQSAVQHTYLQSMLVLFCFALGSVIPMAFIAFLGKKLIGHLQVLKTHASLIRKIMGGSSF